MTSPPRRRAPTPTPPAPLPNHFLRLPPQDVLRLVFHTYCNRISRAHLSLTCKGLRAALVALTPVLTLRWPAVVLSLEPLPDDTSDEEEKEEEEDEEEHDDKELDEEVEEVEEEEDLEWMELPSSTRPPPELLSQGDWQHLRRLEVYNAGLLLPAVAQALLARPFPHLTHLILHTTNMPLSRPVTCARDRMRLRAAMVADMEEVKEAIGNDFHADMEADVTAGRTTWEEALFEGTEATAARYAEFKGAMAAGEEEVMLAAWPSDRNGRGRPARLLLYSPEAYEAGKREDERKEKVPVGEVGGRALGEAWRRGHLPRLECLGLNGAKLKGDVVGALLRAAGWGGEDVRREEEKEGEEMGGEGRRVGSTVGGGKRGEAMQKEREADGGEEETDDMPLLLHALDLGSTDMGYQGARALLKAFRGWHSPPALAPSLPASSSCSSSSVRRRRWAQPLRSLSLGGWEEPDEAEKGEKVEGGKETGMEGGATAAAAVAAAAAATFVEEEKRGCAIEAGLEGRQAATNEREQEGQGGQKEEQGCLVEAMLFSPACRSLEVLRLDEQVALTAEETGSLTRYLAAGRGRKLRELRVEHLGRGMEEGEWEEIFPLIRALTSPLTSSSFLQVLELRDCRLRGEPIECLARALSPFSSSSSLPSSSPAGSNLFPSLRELRLPLCDLEAGDVQTLLQSLKVEAGQERGGGGRGGGGGGGEGERGGEKGGGGSAKALRVLELSGNELGEAGCVALWEGLSEGACPALVELGLVQVRMNDVAMQRGLVEAILRRKREGGREGGACPCLATLEVLRLSNSFLTSEAPTFLAAALNSPAHQEEDDLVVRDGGREQGRGDALQQLRELYWDRARSEDYEYFGNEGMHALVDGRRSFEVGEQEEGAGDVREGHGFGVLSFLPRLEVLSLEHNEVGRKGLETLVEHLEADMDWLNKGWKLARSNRTMRTKKGKKGGREGGREGGEGREDTLLTTVPVIMEGGRKQQEWGKDENDEEEEENKDEEEEEEEEEEEVWQEEEVQKGLRTPRLKLLRLGDDFPSVKTKGVLGHLVVVVEERNSGVRAWRKALKLQRMMEKQNNLKLGLEQVEEEAPEWYANECRLELVGEVC